MRAYLEGEGIGITAVGGFEEPDTPDRLLFVTPQGGAGETKERVFQRDAVQIRCRGSRGNPADAMALADRVDRALMDVSYPLSIGGRHVVSVQWAGGPPALSGRDEVFRSIASCTYVLEIARDAVQPI
jgi:hypothetical protein